MGTGRNTLHASPRSSSANHVAQVRRPTNSSPLTNSRSKQQQFFTNRLDKKQRCKSSYDGTCYPLTPDEGMISLPTQPTSPNQTEDALSARIGMNCPYCLKEFDKNMSPNDVRKHLRKHVGEK